MVPSATSGGPLKNRSVAPTASLTEPMIMNVGTSSNVAVSLSPSMPRSPQGYNYRADVPQLRGKVGKPYYLKPPTVSGPRRGRHKRWKTSTAE